MKVKSKWSGAAFLMLALVLVAGLVLVAAPKAPPVAAEDLAWSSVEGDFPLHGLPPGVGQIIDIAVSGNTVFVLADADAGVDANIEVFRSDDGGYRWEPPNVIALTAAGDTGVAIGISPYYASDGTVVVLATDSPAGVLTGGRVYTSTNRGVTWPAGLVSAVFGLAGDIPNTMALTPNFNALLTGGTVVVGITWTAALTTTTTFYASWQGPNVGWSGWTAAPSLGAVGDATLALECPAQNALYMVGVNVFGGLTHAQTALITAGFPGAVVADQLYAAATVSAAIAIPDDFNPVGAAPAPSLFFAGTNDAVGGNGAVWWYDVTAPGWRNTMAASLIPGGNRDVAGLISSGNYTRATLVMGCYNVPITYTYNVRSQTWSTPMWIEGNGGPIGTVSTTVGVLLAYTGSGNTVYAATTDFVGAYSPGDLCCVSRSDDFAATWSDTCLCSEGLQTNVLDMVWVDGVTGVITCADGPFDRDLDGLVAEDPIDGIDNDVDGLIDEDWPAIESSFKTWDKGLSFKRVDRWQDVTAVALAPDGTIVLLDTGTTGDKVLVSTDNGETFTPTPVDVTLPVTKTMTAIAAGSATYIFVGDIAGHIYVTTDGGATWTDMGALGAQIYSMEVPDGYADAPYVAAGMISSTGLMEILLSSDAGASWAQWGSGSTQATGWGAGTGYIGSCFSPTFDGAADSLLYVHTVGAGWNDVYRGDLSATTETWVRTGCNPTGFQALGIPAIDLVYIPSIAGVDGMTGNALYACMGIPLWGGGLMRGTWNPEGVQAIEPYVNLWRIDVLGAALAPLVNPFAVIADTGAAWGRNGVLDVVYDTAGADVFSVNTAPVPPLPNLVRNWTDTAGFLTPVATTWPADGSIVPSNNTATGEPVQLQWMPVLGAMSYDVLVARDPLKLSRIVFADSIGGVQSPQRSAAVQCEMSIPVGTLTDGATYYWWVRVAQHAGSVVGTNDHQGPWMNARSFTVEAVEMHAAPDLISPASGDTDIGIRPLFKWSGVQDATGYTLLVDDDPAFGSPVIDESLGVQQTYQPAVDLAYETTYSWQVVAVGVDWTSPPADGIFTTIPEWAEPAAPTTPFWIWVLIVLGAVLAITVIVLIVRTRRAV